MRPGQCTGLPRSRPCQLICIVEYVIACLFATLALALLLSPSDLECSNGARGFADIACVPKKVGRLPGGFPTVFATGASIRSRQSLGQAGRAKACQFCAILSRLGRQNLGTQARSACSTDILASLQGQSAPSVGCSSFLEECNSFPQQGASSGTHPSSSFWCVPRKGTSLSFSGSSKTSRFFLH